MLISISRRIIPISLTILVLMVSTAGVAFSQAEATMLAVMSWNVESDGADPTVVGTRIANFEGIDIWGLSEVKDAQATAVFEVSAEVGENANFDSILGTTGGSDRLLIIYDADRFEALGQEELEDINIGGHVRAPLVAHFHDRETEQEFLFMVNHLYRSRADRRREQARLLNQWAEEQPLPVIAVGDYNFDYDVVSGDHDPGLDLLTAGGFLEWVRPAVLTRTQCAATTSDHEVSCRYNSVLDFIFTAGTAMNWPVMSEIIVEAGDFPDDETTSDHRPVLAEFQLPERQTPEEIKRLLLERIDQLEAELAALRQLVEQLPGQ
jgi:hypothetical protein